MNKLKSVGAYVATLACVVGASCTHVERGGGEIVLRGYSSENHGMLNSNIGAPVCIQGRVSINTAGVYFALQPIEEDGVITPGFSRIEIDLDAETARSRGMQNGARHRVCGTLRETTPFQNCENDLCKWYGLEGAELR